MAATNPQGVLSIESKWWSWKTKLPLKRYTPLRGKFGICNEYSSAETASTANLLPSDASFMITLHVLRSKLPVAPRPKPVRPVSQTGQTGFTVSVTPGPQPWFWGPNQGNPPSDGFVAKPTNPAYELRLLAATSHRLHVHDFILLFLHHADRTWSHLAIGSLEPSLLVSHSSEATLAKTFHDCSSPAPMQIKPHSAPAILG